MPDKGENLFEDINNHISSNKEISEEIQNRQKLAGVHSVTNSVELIANGEYCPSFTMSTNDTTEYITITFVPLRNSVFTILITKNEFKNFATQLISFLNGFVHDNSTKTLIKG